MILGGEGQLDALGFFLKGNKYIAHKVRYDVPS
jgi:hypothetical protein